MRPARITRVLLAATFVLAAACSSNASEVAPTSVVSPTTSSAVSGGEVAFIAEVWADNWFSLAVNGVIVGEDSVPVTTERSFNAETLSFRASYPLTIAMVTKDYKADDSGLEYIGTPRQQMGDGGFIAQIKEAASGRVVAVTGPDWRGLVVHRAPLNKECEKATEPRTACRSEIIPEPVGWTAPAFDDRSWVAASTYTAQQVGVKEGYATISWATTARLIWTADLQADNTILWRYTAPRPA